LIPSSRCWRFPTQIICCPHFFSPPFFGPFLGVRMEVYRRDGRFFFLLCVHHALQLADLPMTGLSPPLPFSSQASSSLRFWRRRGSFFPLHSDRDLPLPLGRWTWRFTRVAFFFELSGSFFFSRFNPNGTLLCATTPPIADPDAIFPKICASQCCHPSPCRLLLRHC